MLVVDLDPILIHLGPLAISWYGLAVAVAAAAALWLTVREARRKGIPTDALGDLAVSIVIGSLVGARLPHVVDRWADYAANPAQIFAVHNGGLAILGALLDGFLAGGIAAQQQGLPVRRLFDAAAPGAALAQAIGRLGCLVTGDALGPPTNQTWGIVYVSVQPPV